MPATSAPLDDFESLHDADSIGSQEKFPELSDAVRTAFSASILHITIHITIHPSFPDEPLTDSDVFRYFVDGANDHDDEPCVATKRNECQYGGF